MPPYPHYHPGPGGPPGAFAHSGSSDAPMASNQTRQGDFTLKNILINLALMAGLIFVNKLGAPGNALFYGALALMAMRSSAGALKALSLSTLVTVTNPTFVSLSIVFAVGRLAILFLVAFRFMYDLKQMPNNVFRRPYVVLFIAFCLITAMMSVINGYYVMVSLLKVLAFGTGAFAILVGAEVVKIGRSDITCWVYSLILFCGLLGALTIVTGTGYSIETHLLGTQNAFFRGPFYHSQTLGAIGAIMMVYLLIIFLFSPYPYKWLTLGLLGFFAYMLYRTGSRTGLGTFVIGGGGSVALAFFTTRTPQKSVRFNISKPQLIALGAVAVTALIFLDFFSGGRISGDLSRFLLKYGQFGFAGLSFETLFATRMPLIEEAMMNWRASPLTGIGFGTSTDAYFVANATWYTAPTEKGFIPTAVLEETGIIGTLLFWSFVLAFLVYLVRDRNISGFGIFVTMLAANFGEMMFFSFGGAGGVAWVFIGAGLALGPRCMTSQMQGPPARW